MEFQIKEAMVFTFTGIEFQNGTRIVKISLEDLYSFNVEENDPFLATLCPGMEIDLNFKSIRTKHAVSTSGAEFFFKQLIGVEITDMRYVPIGRFGFSKRALRILNDAGMHTISNVVGMSRKDLELLPGSTKMVSAYIIKVMKSNGFRGGERCPDSIFFRQASAPYIKPVNCM